jgi:hypothetical protein
MPPRCVTIPSVTLDSASVLVKPDAAQRQRDEEIQETVSYLTPSGEGASGQVGEGGLSGNLIDQSVIEKQKSIVRRFHGTVEIDSTRLGRDAGRISDEVIAHLTSLMGAKAKIVLEIDIEVPNGVPEDKVRIISENCNTLKFKGHGFEE